MKKQILGLGRRGLVKVCLRDSDHRLSAKEVLTFLTFEALEMTHTCCFLELDDLVSASGYLVLKQFLGDVLGIQDEEKELGDRLTSLIVEFQCEFENSQESLGEFIYGYWSKRMAEECLPSHDEVESARQAGVKVGACEYSKTFTQFLTNFARDETPESLKYILGEDFDLKDHATASFCRGDSDDRDAHENREDIDGDDCNGEKDTDEDNAPKF
jgi:hypothetical protein